MNSRDKGKRGEREAARLLSDLFGCEFRRSQQYAGNVDAADVVGGPDELHWEVKHQERMQLYKWMEQAQNDCGGKLPCVLHRQNRREWLMTISATELFRLFRILQQGGKPIDNTMKCGALGDSCFGSTSESQT